MTEKMKRSICGIIANNCFSTTLTDELFEKIAKELNKYDDNIISYEDLCYLISNVICKN